MDDNKPINELAAALVKAQGKFPSIPKNKTANVGKYTYKYADLPDILEAVIPVLNKHGLCIMQAPDGDSLVTTLMHESGQCVTGRIPLPMKTSPQELGSWLTYLRRYSLTGMLGIAADEDDDAGSAQAAHTSRKTTPPAPAIPPPAAKPSDYEAKVRDLFDDGVAALLGKVDDPRAEMKTRFGRLLGHRGYEKASEIPAGQDRNGFVAEVEEMIAQIREAQS
jgi:hypothetical protein